MEITRILFHYSSPLLRVIYYTLENINVFWSQQNHYISRLHSETKRNMKRQQDDMKKFN